MKLYKERANDKANRLSTWHEWFAWYPVYIDGNGYVWLETVQRKIAYGLAVNGIDKGARYLPRFTSSYDNPDFAPDKDAFV